jgi:hypothetical protein
VPVAVVDAGLRHDLSTSSVSNHYCDIANTERCPERGKESPYAKEVLVLDREIVKLNVLETTIGTGPIKLIERNFLRLTNVI